MSLTVKEAAALSHEAEILHGLHKYVTKEADDANEAFHQTADTIMRMYATAPDELKAYAEGKTLYAGGINLATMLGQVLIESAFAAGDAEALVQDSLAFGIEHFYANEEGYWELALLEDQMRTGHKLLEDAKASE